MRTHKWEGWGTDWNGLPIPKWFDWPHWGLALGSNLRYQPRWWERRAYVMGLRDSARIVEDRRTEPVSETLAVKGRARLVTVKGSEHLRASIRAIHARARKLMGLPPDSRSGLE